MATPKSVETRLIQVLAGIALVAILGVLAILPYRLYERDIRRATEEAHRISSLLHAALGQALARGEDVTDLVNRFQGLGELEVRLTRLEGGEAHPAARSRRGSSSLRGTDLTYLAAPLLDQEGRTWRAEMLFDLAPMKRESVRLIIDLCLAVVLGSAVFSGVVFWLVRHFLVVPLREATDVIERHDPSTEIVRMPAFASREMARLAAAVEQACRAHHEAT